MLVDNPVQQSYFSNPNFSDFSDIFNTDLFTNDNLGITSSNSSNSPETASSSRASSPQSPFTPPQPASVATFPDFAPSAFFNFLEDEQSKQLEPMSIGPLTSSPYDFVSNFCNAGEIGMASGIGMDVNMDGAGYAMNLISETMGIDPQLVGTPSEIHEDEEYIEDISADADVSVSSSSPAAASSPPAPVAKTSRASKKSKEKEKEKEAEAEREKLTLVIQPVKAGGHGKARKGTVASGGIVKKSASATTAVTKDKENSNISSTVLPPPTYTSPSSFIPTNIYPPKGATKNGSENGKDADDDDDDLPQDWRPSPEVFQKMTSKEKRQLRNKISARNFRVRRKEYISTLEGDIAERDRLLDAIRSELGSTQSENYALRQEIAALKRTLLEGRGIAVGSPVVSAEDSFPLLNLPPPAPLPAQSAAATLAQAAAAAASARPTSPALTPANATAAQLLTANTQKDASASGRFWGGASTGMRLGMGGITPVHRVVLPEVSVADLLLGQFGNANAVVREEKLQENLNPLLNGPPVVSSTKQDVKNVLGFDGFADVNPFTMKTLDAYRMHLWGKMAAQHHTHQQLQQQQQHQQHHAHLTGLASSLRPAFFSAPTTPATSLSALLSGKHTPAAAPPYTLPTPSTPPPPYQSAPPSPLIGLGKSGVAEKLEREKERERERQKEKETAMYAALASQTLLRKLGSAFWDAFSGGAGPVASGSGSGASAKAWDSDKVRRVLEGKAVVRVVDIEEPPPPRAPRSPTPAAVENMPRKCTVSCAVSDILEESMRSLSIGKKA
ncbi:hypothetical protein H0H81_010988 [Sphagnurus paluster]|uniref:BZIP domain-containing protein n=1 Tax=Sphagnurus paluster TaxID=117069 RepID=A0A9P7KNP5_9AGAR|nr:hypothetical protein H0H81_010988 [Sphagnurus paluster]